MSPDLPPTLRQAVATLLEGVTRSGIAERADRISRAYRAGETSGGVIRDQADATAYVLTRLPATYAAAARAFHETAERVPDFAPRSLLDVGSGPGGAAWAAVDAWPGLGIINQLDSNPALLAMSEVLAGQAPPALQAARRIRADMTTDEAWPQCDLVVTSYALAEIGATRQAKVIEKLWTACRHVLIIVEPGTTEGWRRILAARTALIGLGAQVIAPCPHAAACPVAETPQTPGDWCHFTQRLSRSRDHREAKAATVPYEDEKFIYLAVARAEVTVHRPSARVLAPPQFAKPAITLKLCTSDGSGVLRPVARRDKPAYAQARRLSWGDAFD